MNIENIVKNVDIGNVITTVKKFSKSHSSEILLAVAIVAGVSATITAIRATKKSVEKIEEIEDKLSIDELPKKEVFKSCWKYYIYPAVSTGISIAAMLYSHKMMQGKVKAITAAYALSESALKEYKQKLLETSSEDARKVQNDIVSRSYNSTEPSKIIETGHGDVLYHDPWTGRWFKCSKDYLDACLGKLAGIIYHEDIACMNDLYYLLSNELHDCISGNVWGWTNDRRVPEASCTADYTDTGIPYIELGFTVDPTIIDSRIR